MTYKPCSAMLTVTQKPEGHETHYWDTHWNKREFCELTYAHEGSHWALGNACSGGGNSTDCDCEVPHTVAEAPHWWYVWSDDPQYMGAYEIVERDVCDISCGTTTMGTAAGDVLRCYLFAEHTGPHRDDAYPNLGTESCVKHAKRAELLYPLWWEIGEGTALPKSVPEHFPCNDSSCCN